MEVPKKIFIDGPAWVGDMVMAQSLFKQLKQSFPDVTIDVLAPAWAQGVLERMPEVHRVWLSPFGHGDLKIKQRYQLAKSLRVEQYEWAIVLRNSFKSALIPFWAKIPRRTGWRGEMRYIVLNEQRKLNKQHHPLIVERYLALASLPSAAKAPLSKPYPLPRLSIDERSLTNALQKLALPRPTTPVLILCPGAEFGPSKRWPVEYFAEIAKAKLHQGWQVWLLGSKKDQSITASINVLTDGRCADLAGRTELTEAIDLLSLANLVVSNDSGLMHVAAAVGCKVVALYGSTPTQIAPPLVDHAKMLSLNLSCSPCFKRECPLGHFNCMKKMSPTQVLTAMEELQGVETV